MMSQRLTFDRATNLQPSAAISRHPMLSITCGTSPTKAHGKPIVGPSSRTKLDAQRRMTMAYFAASKMGFQINLPGRPYVNAANLPTTNTAEDCVKDLAEHLLADRNLELSPQEAVQVAAEYGARRNFPVNVTPAMIIEVEQNLMEISGVPLPTIMSLPETNRSPSADLTTKPKRDRTISFDPHVYAEFLKKNPITQFQDKNGAHLWLLKLRDQKFIPMGEALNMANQAFGTAIASTEHHDFLQANAGFEIVSHGRQEYLKQTIA